MSKALEAAIPVQEWGKRDYATFKHETWMSRCNSSHGDVIACSHTPTKAYLQGSK